MKKYIFPTNYDYSNKFLGIIEYKLLLPLGVLSFILLFLLSLFEISIFSKIGIFIIIIMPLFLTLNTYINGEPFYLFIIFVIKHKLHSNRYILK